MKVFEVTYIEAGRTFYWSEADCRKHFRKNEWPEYKRGCLPHITVFEVRDKEPEPYPPCAQ